MKIALFAAVPEEVGTLADKVNFTGIGRENATSAMLQFMTRHQNEEFWMMNIGTVGSHNKPVGTILSIREIISAGAVFYNNPMLLSHFDLQTDKNVQTATLYSSDCFVSPAVFQSDYLYKTKMKADCFDMESSVLFCMAKFWNKPFVSYKIVSDNLNVTIAEWQQRVETLSKELVKHIHQVIDEISQNEPVIFLK